MNVLFRKSALVFSSLIIALLLAPFCLSAQSLTALRPAQETAQSNAELGAKIQALTDSLERTQSELAESRAEIQQLHGLLEMVLQKMGGQNAPGASAQSSTETQLPSASVVPNAPAITEDDWQILNAKVDQQEQVKVESESRYRLKLSGIALFNAFDTVGQTDNLDLPSIALPRTSEESASSLGASLRQSMLGLRGIGPTFLGADTSADLQLDFIGGTGVYGGVSAGIASLRIARIRFDWQNTSAIAGLDSPFFSPNSPTSYMSLVVPAFSSAGNLWVWTPTLRVEHRFDSRFSQFRLEAGLLDPGGYYVPVGNQRVPTPGESSGQPTYALRISANNRSDNRPASIGISSIYSPLRFQNGARVSGWGALADWKLPLIARMQLSGAFFGGRGLDSFGGLAIPAIPAQDQQEFNYAAQPVLARIDSVGGWSQLKFTASAKNEFNAGAGVGARDLEALRAALATEPLLGLVPDSNRVFFINYIFRPRGDLLFSAEYRRLRTDSVMSPSADASQIGLAAGFLF